MPADGLTAKDGTNYFTGKEGSERGGGVTGVMELGLEMLQKQTKATKWGKGGREESGINAGFFLFPPLVPFVTFVRKEGLGFNEANEGNEEESEAGLGWGPGGCSNGRVSHRQSSGLFIPAPPTRNTCV